MSWLWQSLYHAAAMLWEMLWALVLGFGISAVLQVFVSKEKMASLFGRTGFREVALAIGLGAASSSCSYAAAATAKTAFKKGADLVPSLTYMLASTNLVIELGLVLWMLMGWRFVAAETAGAFVMVAIMWLLVRMTLPRGLIEEARDHSETGEDEGCCHHSSGHEHHEHHQHGADEENASTWKRVADSFFMDGSMLWKEIVIGVLIAGFLMVLVPHDWWQALFLSKETAYPLRLFENALVGPLVAVASFVCSVGNIPLASLLWASGCTFGGVISFIYGDLIVLPLIAAYRKYYGGKAAAYITAILFASMVGAGIIVDLLFAALGWIPQSQHSHSEMSHATFAWNYTTWLDFAALLLGGWLVFLHFRKSEPAHVSPRHPHHESRHETHATH